MNCEACGKPAEEDNSRVKVLGIFKLRNGKKTSCGVKYRLCIDCKRIFAQFLEKVKPSNG